MLIFCTLGYYTVKLLAPLDPLKGQDIKGGKRLAKSGIGDNGHLGIAPHCLSVYKLLLAVAHRRAWRSPKCRIWSLQVVLAENCS